MLLGAFQFGILDWNSDIINWVIRVFIASACGFAIGMERKSRSKEAGIRTHTIVCMASALMMIVSKYGFTDMGEKASDYGRIAAQVVSGIGFLGAGIIFYKRDFLHGLTTAAGIWATSGIGLAIGAGLIGIGVITTALLVVLQIILHRPLRFLKGTTTTVLKMTIRIENPDVIDKLTYIFDVKKYLKFKTTTGENNVIIADVELATDVNFSAKEIYEFTKTYDFIQTIEKTDEL